MLTSKSLLPQYDLIIIGSGGGAVIAALAALKLGKRAVILEKQEKFGGSTSLSGGVWWVPANPLLAEAGIADDRDNARKYLASAVEYEGPGVTPKRQEAFLAAAPRMVEFLRSFGMKFIRPTHDWPDYYDDRPGGLPEGRSLLAAPFNLNELGAAKDKLALYPPAAHMPMGSDAFTSLFLFKRTWSGKLTAMKFAALMAKDKLLGRHTVANGAAIQGRMLQIALREGVEIHCGIAVDDFIMENGRIVGVKANQAGRQVDILASGGVIANTGGFSRNAAMRAVHAKSASSDQWTNANIGDTGEVLQAMINLGGAVDCMDTAWWVMTSHNVDGSWPEGATGPTGLPQPFLHHLDLSLPYSIMVDQDGRRIANEAGSYMEVGERVHARQIETGRAIPAWVIFDSRQRKWYPWGNAMPGKTPAQWLESGYMKKADTLAELAALCGIDAAGLAAEVERFNGFCREGIDRDYGRGSRAFDNSHGDPSIKPNPNLGPIEQGPFYAVAMYPGDVGTAGGVVVDEFARVLCGDGTPIEGLYAVGNCTASAFGRCYPGAGASIASAFTFGWLAAYHSLGEAAELRRLIS